MNAVRRAISPVTALAPRHRRSLPDAPLLQHTIATVHVNKHLEDSKQHVLCRVHAARVEEGSAFPGPSPDVVQLLDQQPVLSWVEVCIGVGKGLWECNLV